MTGRVTKRLGRFGPLLLLVAPLVVAAQESSIPLWQLQPFDRVKIRDGSIHDINPVRIPGDAPIEDVEDAYVGQPGLPPLRDLHRSMLYRITLQSDGMDYHIYGRHILTIEYFEDLLLAEAKQQLRNGQIDNAFLCIGIVEGRDPHWPGLLEAKIAFHADEAEFWTLKGNWERAFWSLVEEKRQRDRLLEENPDSKPTGAAAPEQVRGRIENMAQRWFEREQDGKRWADCRRVVARLEEVYPDSAAALRWRRDFATQARKLLAQATAQQDSGNWPAAIASMDQAIELYPDLDDVRQTTQALYAKHPYLRVGVERLPRFASGPAYWSPADWRCSDLLHLPLMRLVSLADGGQFDSQIIDRIDRGNINRQATLALRDGLVWPGDQKPVTVTDVQRLLAECCNIDSDMYHPAFSRLVTNIEPLGPAQLRIDFDRPQFQPAAWLQIPFLRLGYDPSATPWASTYHGVSGLGPYRLHELQPQRGVFVANEHFAQPERPLIRQITEETIPDSAQRLVALKKREIDLVEYVPPRHHQTVASIPHARLLPLGLPRVHLLQFNLSNRALQNRTLRRAIDYAIDRAEIFRVLGLNIDEQNCPVTGPLPIGSFGYNDAVQPRAADAQLAAALLTAVSKELKGLPTLTLVHDGNETSLAACREIVRQLSRVGLKVNLVDMDGRGNFNPRNADLRYEIHTSSDPVYDLVTLLLRNNPQLARHASPWLRQLLVDLVEVPNAAAARDLLPEIHRVLHEDVAILPLWQWRDYYAAADTLVGPSESPPEASGLPATRLYQEAASWRITPNFPPAQWGPRNLEAQP